MSTATVERWQWDGPSLLRTARTLEYTYADIPIDLEQAITLAVLLEFDLDVPPTNSQSLTPKMTFWLQDRIGDSGWHIVASCHNMSPGKSRRLSMRISSPVGDEARLVAFLDWSTNVPAGSDPSPSDGLLHQLAARNIKAWALVRKL